MGMRRTHLVSVPESQKDGEGPGQRDFFSSKPKFLCRGSGKSVRVTLSCAMVGSTVVRVVPRPGESVNTQVTHKAPSTVGSRMRGDGQWESPGRKVHLQKSLLGYDGGKNGTESG